MFRRQGGRTHHGHSRQTPARRATSRPFRQFGSGGATMTAAVSVNAARETQKLRTFLISSSCSRDRRVAIPPPQRVRCPLSACARARRRASAFLINQCQRPARETQAAPDWSALARSALRRGTLPSLAHSPLSRRSPSSCAKYALPCACSPCGRRAACSAGMGQRWAPHCWADCPSALRLAVGAVFFARSQHRLAARRGSCPMRQRAK